MPKMRFFEIYEKLTLKVFLTFLHKVTVAYKLKIYLNDFFGRNLVLRFFGRRKAKMRFFRYYKKIMHGTFLIFSMKLQQNKNEMVFLEITLFRNSRVKYEDFKLLLKVNAKPAFTC